MTKEMEELLSKLDFSKIEARTLAYYMDKNRIRIVEITDEDLVEEMRGWYICFMEDDEKCYDSVGPYDTFEQAAHVMYQTRSE